MGFLPKRNSVTCYTILCGTMLCYTRGPAADEQQLYTLGAKVVISDILQILTGFALYGSDVLTYWLYIKMTKA